MRPRIAHVISTVEGVGGAEQLLAAIVAGGDARGWEQVVLNPFVDQLSPAFAPLVEQGRYHSRPCRRLWQLPGTWRWVGRQLERFQPDVVHVLLFHAGVTVATLPRRQGVRHLLTHVYGEGIRLPPLGALKERLDRWAGRRYDRVVAISESGHRLLVDDYRYPPETVVRIAPGWNGRPLERSGKSPAPTIVCVAKLRPEKGHRLLLEAMAQVRDRLPDVRLVLVGDGEQGPALVRQAAAMRLEDNVEFAGAVPEVWPYLADAHVFALASQSEAFGIAIVEAMAAGLPVVAPAVGGIPELVRPGESGELFHPGDHDALAGHLVRLLTSPELRARMGAAAREAAEPYRMEHSVERYVQLFSDLSGSSAAPAP